MNKAPQKTEGQWKLYEGKARYIFYVAAGLFGVVCSIIFLFALLERILPSTALPVGGLISLGCAIVSSFFHSKSRKRQFLFNVVKIFFWSVIVSANVLLILFLIAILGT
jgi:hypothetical protein